MKKFYLFILLLVSIFTNNIYSQLACPIDSCGNFSNYFINTGPVITTNQEAIDSGFYYTIDQSLIFGADTTVCYAFIQPATGDWSRLQLFVSYPNCPAGNSTNYTGYGSGASSFSNGNWSSSVSTSSSGPTTCVSGKLTGNPDQDPPGSEKFTTLGTFQYPNCNKIASTLVAGNSLSQCAPLVNGQTYKHCFKIIKSSACPGKVVISPIITCTNHCVPAGKACKPIEYLSTVTNSTCAGNNLDGAIALTVCGNKKLTFLWNDLTTAKDRNNLAPGPYQVKITDSESTNCDTVINFTVKPEVCGISIPNIITPNGDKDNQFFSIDGLENYPNSSLEIFDRWGLKIYENSNYLNDWDGLNYKNKTAVSDGVYYYILHQSDKGQTIHTGFIQVIRG